MKTSNGANGNTAVQVAVMRLAAPARIAPDASVYVVWVVPQNGEPQNVGALRVNSNLEGTLDTVTPHRAFRLLVTPEPSATGDKPTHDPVFTADIAARG
ncbi:MAG: hypothetical protein JNG84_00010 [Archangium sp.]|nr:hypothetical protein [Archangium sp.]